ncbi:Ort1p [Rhizophagus irregularis DAOM 197198w]|uniref:Ort1p n=2 Tax=Rhizophagus irregularis TaxID=588596 RepID=A0A015LA98_RHIIW|nr:Ort1p [Rhizophagus irregularis DAOM 197198w]
MAKKRVEIRWFSGSLIGIPADLSGRTQSILWNIWTYRLPVFGRVENSTSEHLTRKVRGNDLSSRYCTLSSERRFGFRSLVDACSDSLANSMISAVLFTTYITVFSQFNGTSSFFESDYNHSLHSPPPFSIVFTSGAIVGAAQSLVAAPLDSLKVRFEVNDLLEGKHKSMFVFAKTTWKELGVASIYRGIGLTLVKDSLSCGLFFGIFEFVKQQCYNA